MSVYLKNITITLTHRPHEADITLIDNLNFEIQGGQVLSVMGPSGSGKSTLLHFITGVIDKHAFVYQGEVLVNKVDVSTLPTEKRKIGLFSQEGLLFPHMTVEENLLYAVPHVLSKSQKKEVVEKALDDAQLKKRYARVYPHTLSGGQQSRLALARTLLSEPQLLLLDEPFAKLDTDLHAAIRTWVWTIIENSRIPAIIVTHDKNDIYNQEYLYHIGSNTKL